MTKVNLELLTDYGIYLMIESGKRGSISQVTHHYAKANNTYMKNFNKNNQSVFLEYLDANNLYGWSMIKKLPTSRFKWSNDLNKYTQEYIQKYDENSDHGAILEVDVDYPKYLRSLHKDLPFLQKKGKLNGVEKLIVAFEDKKRYVINISTLKQALDHGLKLKKLHRIIEFTQSACLKNVLILILNKELMQKINLKRTSLN